jgi:hypothetical protein
MATVCQDATFGHSTLDYFAVNWDSERIGDNGGRHGQGVRSGCRRGGMQGVGRTQRARLRRVEHNRFDRRAGAVGFQVIFMCFDNFRVRIFVDFAVSEFNNV